MAKTGTKTVTSADPGSSTTGGAFTEFGATGLRQYSGYVREEWLRALIGRKGMRVLREMRDNDPIISAIFFAIEMLLRSVVFRVEPADENNPEDKKAADFVQSCFGDMEHSWADLVADILSFLQFGWGVYEIVYKYRRGENPDDPKTNSNYDDGLIGWRKFAGRAQETLLHWVFNDPGDAISMVQLLPTGGPLLNVPLSKCLHFRTTPYKANPEGRSILRSMYSYYFNKRNIMQIEAIGISRDLGGVVNIRVPSSWTKADAPEDQKLSLAKAQAMANNINNNEQTGIVSPMIYDENKNEIFKIELLSTAGRRAIVTNEVIARYDHGIASSMLADFITLGTGSSRGVGSFAQSKNKTDMFSVAVVGYLDIVASQFERKACPDLLAINAMKGKVKVTHGDIARRDLDVLGQYIANIAAAGAIVPDASLDAHLREEGGLPAPDDPEAVPNEQADEKDQAAAALEAKTPPAGPGGKPPLGEAPAPGARSGGTVQKRRRKPL